MSNWKKYFASGELGQVAIGAVCGALIAVITLYGTLRTAAVGEQQVQVKRRAVAVEEQRQEHAAAAYVRSLNEDLREQNDRLHADLDTCRGAKVVTEEKLAKIALQMRVLQIENEELRERMDELEAIVGSNA